MYVQKLLNTLCELPSAFRRRASMKHPHVYREYTHTARDKRSQEHPHVRVEYHIEELQ